MDRKNIEQYLGRNVEIMLMPDGRKTSGVLLRCEDDLIALGSESGEALFVYPMIWGISPLSSEPPAVKTQPSPVIHHPVAAPVIKPSIPAETVIAFLDELDECFDELEVKSQTYILNTEYVRRFRTDRQDKIQTALDSILTKYSYAVKVHEDRPYSMRMRQISDEAKNLWRSNQSSIPASEVYGFVLYLMSENAKSVKIYMGIHDFRAAFTAATTAASKMLAAACLIVSEPVTPRNFSVLLKLEPPQVNAILRWLLMNVIANDETPRDYRELCFRCVCALIWKNAGYSSWPDKTELFTQNNIDAVRSWLETQRADPKIIDDALRLSDKSKMPHPDNDTNLRRIDWSVQRFEGEFDYFNPNRDKLYGFIKCPALKKYNVPLRSEGSVFIHLNQVEDRRLRRKLLTCGKMKPMIRVTFLLGNNVEGPAAFSVREKSNDTNDSALAVDMMSALSEEGEIEFFMRYNDPPFGKVIGKDKKLYTFNEKNITDPLLAVFLEVNASPDGHPVRFTRGMTDSGKVQIQNVESAIPFPDDKVKAWEESGLIQKARERLSLVQKKNEPEAESESEQEELTPEIEELINRGYVPLDVYTPETKGMRSETPFPQEEPTTSKPGTVETFNELPKFLQDKIKSVTAGNYSTKYLTDTYYSRGHSREVRAAYMAMVSRFNNDDIAMTNAERAERCFAMARYVYNFFALADESDKRQYPASEEDNIRVMAYKGLEYLIYSQLDGASRNEANYDTARRYCLLKIADEIQEARRIDENNAWLRIYIYSYFVNGLRFHSSSGKWSAQNVTLSGCSLLEFNDFGKFFEGLLTLAYVTGAELVMPTLKALLNSLEYSGSLLGKLGLDESVYSQDNANKEIISSFQKSLDDWGKRSDIMIQDAEVKLSPELLRILSVQQSIVSLMKRELARILGTTPEKLDDALKRANPILASEEYTASLEKTRRKYNPDAGLLDVLPINVLGAVMRQYWNDCFGAYFGGKPYSAYWKERFAKLQWVRDPVFHAHPEYIKNEDIEEARAVCIEIAECLRGKN
ncbi:MAG: hypothetical protein IJP89_07270 [Synergistaceae bacterium]|nr:hypothetical protein [Synergistaceae bacterium]